MSKNSGLNPRMEVWLGLFILYSLQYSIQQCCRRWRASGDVNIYRDDLVHAAEGCITFTEYAAIASAVAYCNNELW